MVIGQKITGDSFCQAEILQELIKPVNSVKNIDVLPSSSTANSKITTCLRSVLLRAELECRLIIGLPAAVKQLSVEPEDTLFCVVISSRDSATHMQEVLLRAFCFENDIYTVQADSAEKLGRMLNVFCGSCVLVQKSSTATTSLAEEALIDFCEDYWDAPVQPVVPLPET